MCSNFRILNVKLWLFMYRMCVCVLGRIGRRFKRQVKEDSKKEDEPRTPRKFCDGGGVFCALYRAFQGENGQQQVAERREELGTNVPR